MVKKSYWKLAASILLCQLAGVIGSFFTSSSVSTWYLTLKKPFFNPPNWLFGPVWVSLYLLMGVSLYLVWNREIRSAQSKKALYLFGVQLILNVLWSALFFGLRSPLSALIGIVVLWIVILFTIKYFYNVSKAAAYLLIPYILWVSFAMALNFSISWLN